MASYPETSGYIIRTFLRVGETERAIRISKWLRTVQLANGSIPMGFYSSNAANPFDTSQVLRGWITLQQLHPDPRTEESIDRAVAYLENSWRTEQWGSGRRDYYIRNVEPLRIYGSPLVDEIVDYFAARIDTDFWPEEAEDDDYPLTHFLVYIARGFHDIGEDYLARGIAERLAEHQLPSGAFVGRFSRAWQPSSDWICVPAIAQAAVLWHKLEMYKNYDNAMRYIKTLDAPWSCEPHDAPYLPGAQLNWTAKFVADAYAIAD